MTKIFTAVVALISVTMVHGKPQLITLKDGKIGVNFAGYHAEAGLGGLLTGNGAHGGLSASAGTPWGPAAGAGLGGSVDGKTAGGLYAGATAGHGVGASAALGGKVDEYGAYGGEGAEAHAGGLSTKTVKLGANGVVKKIASVQSPVDTRFAEEDDNEVPQPVYTKPKTKLIPPPPQSPKVNKKVTIVEKVIEPTHADQPFDYKNFLDFGFFSNLGAIHGGAHNPGGNQVIIEKTYYPPPPPPPPKIHKQVYVSKRVNYEDRDQRPSSGQPSATFYDQVFAIPQSVLSSVNTFLNGQVGHPGGFTKTKTISYTR